MLYYKPHPLFESSGVALIYCTLATFGVVNFSRVKFLLSVPPTKNPFKLDNQMSDSPMLLLRVSLIPRPRQTHTRTHVHTHTHTLVTSSSGTLFSTVGFFPRLDINSWSTAMASASSLHTITGCSMNFRIIKATWNRTYGGARMCVCVCVCVCTLP